MAEIIAEILGWYLDIKYWFKHKKRRKFEKENNLPKSIVWHPITKPLLIAFPIFIICFSLLSYNSFKDRSLKNTKAKISKIESLLSMEKEQFGYYPRDLKTLIRNNPLNKNLLLDGWNTNFYYKLVNDSLHYQLISLGRDRELNTEDDITNTN
ncbi:type II secretion system protein GspG [Polaribacter sp. P097]|uniref:type II secretion system protein GspG n=1 Tax=Polaribacter sp. P097 TaxID=3117398 RepID=UPI002FE04798